MNKLNVFVLLLLSLQIFISCRTDNKDKILSVDWVSNNDNYSVIIKDSTIQFNVPDSCKDLMETKCIENLVLRIKHVTTTKIYTTGDKNHFNDSISYGVKYMNGKPILVLNCIYTLLNLPKIEALTFSTDSKIKLAESKDFDIPAFEIEGYKLNDTISLDSISYFANFFKRYSLLKNSAVEFQIIGNKIISITKNNIKEYEINEIVKSTDLKFHKKHIKLSNNYYVWSNSAGDFIQLGIDLQTQYDGVNMFYSLNYSNSYVENMAKIEFKDDIFYENIKIRKEKVMNLLPHGTDTNDFYKISNAMSKILLIDNKYYDAYYVLGQLAKIEKNMVGAKQNYKKCIELNPYHANAIIELGLLYYDLKEYSEFLECMEKGIKLSPDNPTIYKALTFYYFVVKNDTEKACTYANLAYVHGDNNMLKVINQLCGGPK